MRELPDGVADFIDDVQHGTFLIDFWAEWCPPCKAMEPILHNIDSEGLASVLKVNADTKQDLAAKYGIQSLPTLIVFKDGTEVHRFIGATSRDRILEIL